MSPRVLPLVRDRPLIYFWHCGPVEGLADRARRAVAGRAEIVEFAGVEPMLERLTSGAPQPALIVLVRARPALPDSDDVARVAARAPLVPLVMLAREWCDGEPRTGRGWAGVPRSPASQFAPQFEQFLDAWHAGRCSPWELPSTAGEDERLLHGLAPRAAARRPATATGDRGTAIVLVEHPATRDWLLAVCSELGYAPIASSAGALPHLHSPRAPSAVLWHTPPGLPGGEHAIRHVRAQWPGARLVGLANFPRAEDLQAWDEAGFAAVLSLPLWIDNLAAALAPA